MTAVDATRPATVRDKAEAPWLRALLALLLGAASACAPDPSSAPRAPSGQAPAPVGELATLSLSLSLVEAPPALDRVRVELRREGLPTVERSVEPGFEPIIVVFGVAPGLWDLRVSALDADGHILLCAMASVTVLAGQLTPVSVMLTDDAGCATMELDCADGLDDDGDGAVDCADTDCDGQLCDDGDPCTALDLCGPGGCDGSAPVSCDDGDPCTLDACDPGLGCLYDPIPGCCVAAADCDDGDACTADGCAGGGCVHGAAPCDDGDPCTMDACDPATGCTAAWSPALLGAPCDDGDPCTSGDGCDPTGCEGAPLGCDDGDPCTVDSCAVNGCAHAPTAGPCNDGDACTVGESCAFGDGCSGGLPVLCEDGDPCHGDGCVPLAGCVPIPRVAEGATACTQAATCDDGDPCTVDACLAGACVSAPLDCPTALGDACAISTCIDGACLTTGAVSCDDGDPCTVDACDPAVGCVHHGACGCLDDAACDDGDPCTAERCTDGACVVGPVAEVCGNGVDDDCDGATDAACVWRVAAGSTSPAPDGRSWATAFPTVQQAMAVAAAGDAVWVAAGVYRATVAGQSVVTLQPGVALRGGFTGDEEAAALRPTPLAPTILSGDTDLSGTHTSADAQHVVVGASDARLEGLVIRDGNAPYPSGLGGGLYNHGVSGMTVERCRFVANYGAQGGGLHDDGTAPGATTRLSDVIFEGNEAVWGAGARLVGGQPVELSGCVFANNVASSGAGALLIESDATAIDVLASVFAWNSGSTGGAVGVKGATATVRLGGCTFYDNSGGSGGAINVLNSSDVSIEGGTLRGNTGQSGGAVLASSSGLSLAAVTLEQNRSTIFQGGALRATAGSLTVDACELRGNETGQDGGGLQYAGPGTVSVTGSTFRCNRALGSGGGFMVGSAGGVIQGCDVTDNTSGSVGGGVYAVAYSGPVEATLFSGNLAKGAGGGLGVANSPAAAVRRCRFEGNTSGAMGGGLSLVTKSAIPVVDSAFVGNVAANGGGIGSSGSDAAITGCCLSGNAATSAGGGIQAQFAAPVVRNTAFWDNQAAAFPSDLFDGSGASLDVGWSCFAVGPAGQSNVLLTEDPFVVDPSGALLLVHAGLGGAVASSPCVDAGSDTAATASGLPWETLTTRLDGAPDVTPVDAGCHY